MSDKAATLPEIEQVIREVVGVPKYILLGRVETAHDRHQMLTLISSTNTTFLLKNFAPYYNVRPGVLFNCHYDSISIWPVGPFMRRTENYKVTYYAKIARDEMYLLKLELIALARDDGEYDIFLDYMSVIASQSYPG